MTADNDNENELNAQLREAVVKRYPTAQAIAEEMERLHVKLAFVASRSDREGVYYSTECEGCGLLLEVECFFGTGMPTASAVAQVFATALERCTHEPSRDKDLLASVTGTLTPSKSDG